ncbi:MAG: right-handed parallel beta-helix repeat-containing protein [Hymenobacteraceae bacterium]|nr:right-handed parallel beta-helix repeat-containing protein [Hymenobacteraceae bacterium]
MAFLLALLPYAALHAQTTVTVGTGTSSSSTSAGPLYISSASSTYKYSKNIAIYSATELLAAGATAGNIQKISWYKTDAQGYTNSDAQFDIYMKNVSNSTHSSSPVNWANEVAGATLVYSSTTQNLNTAVGWQEFTLSNPFFWNGSDNLEIFVDWHRPGSPTGAVGWQYTTTTNANAITGSSSTVSTASRNSNRPNIQLEFAPMVGVDAGVHAINSPVSPVQPGQQPVQATIRSFGTDTLRSATIGWSVNGTMGTPYSWTGQLGTGDSSSVITLGNFNFTSGSHLVKVWTKNPNGGTDINMLNDTMEVSIISCTAASGVYTINAAQPTAGTNFASFSDAADRLATCGISGNVTLNVAPNSGPYYEQVEFLNIPGSNNFTVTVNGRNQKIVFAPKSSTEPYVVRLNGAQNIILDSLQIEVADSATYGWGIHLTNDASFNMITNNTITIPTNTTSSNFSGIIASGSLSSNSAAGTTTSSTIIANNNISGGYYGIRINGDAGGTGAIGNLIVNNRVEDFYYYGIYVNNTDVVKIVSNTVTRPTRSTVSSFYGIYLTGSISGAAVAKNILHNTHGGATSSTAAAYGIYLSNADAPSGSENNITNNVLYDFNGNGTIYALYNNGSDGAHYFFNTVSLDNVASTTSSVTRGLYQTGQASNIVFKNNIISITRGSSGTEEKTAIYLNTTGSTVSSNNNVFYVNGANPDNYIGSYGSTKYSTLADWQLNTGLDSMSINVDPMFTNLATGNLQPSNPAVNNIGVPVAVVFDDINGTSRSATTPDPGAYEFTIQGLDAAIQWVSPTFAGAAGPKNITVEVTNTKVTPITSVRLAYTDGTVTQTETFSSLNIQSGASQTLTFTTPYNLTAAAQLYAYIVQVNNRVDDEQINDTTSLQSICPSLAGNFTINSAVATGGVNFQSFTDAVNAINNCGINGPVTFTVAPGSGPYIEQVELMTIQGASATNTITFNGNNAVIAFDAGSADRHVIKLNGAKHVTIDSLTINALNDTYGWGIHLVNEADSNRITNNTINVASSSTSSSNSIGIVATNSNTSVSSTGANANHTVIANNTVNGGYYGIRLNGISTGRAYNNHIVNNNVKNFYSYGIYLYYADSTLVEANEVSRPDTSRTTTFYGIYVGSNTWNSLISKNRIHTPFGADTSKTSSAYALYTSSADAPQGAENKFVNNLVYDFKSAGTIYAIYNSSSNSAHYFHNTVVLDHAAASTSSSTRGFYQTSTASNIEIKNNIFYITRGGTGSNYGLYFSTTASGIISDNNVFFVDAQNTDIGYHSGAKATLADWQQANNNAFDQNSIVADPQFTNVAAANFEPMNPAINNMGAPVGVAEDINGVVRSTTTPDPGAYEFTIVGRDAAIAWIAPLAPVSGGNQTVVVEVTNILTAPITSLRLAYTDGTTPVVQDFTSLSIASGASQQFTFTTPYMLTSPANLRAYIIHVNGSADDNQNNDTTATQTICSSLAGAYTINSGAATAGTNFQSFSDAANALNSCGISGPVSFTVVAGSGPYNERFMLTSVLGASAANMVTINGNGAELRHTGTSTERAAVTFDGADYITIDSLNIVAADSTYGWGVHFTNDADHNTIRNSSIRVVSTSTTSSNSAGIVASSSVSSATATGNNASYNTIENNTIEGGYYGIRINGTTNAAGAVGNRIVGNTVQDFRAYGISIDDADSTVVSGNDVSRPTRTSVSTFYGLAISGDTKNSLVEKNRVHNPFDGDRTSTSSVFGVWSSSNDAPAGQENLIVNNLIYNLNGEGIIYGIYNSSSNGSRYYHNTISVTDTASGVTRDTRGFYQTTTASNIEFVNNIIYITRGGTGNKYGIYFNASASTVLSNNNVIHVNGAFGTGNIGYAGTAMPTLTAWRAAGHGSNSTDADPMFANAAAGDFAPTNPLIDNVGRPVAAVTTDILGNTRSTTTPDAGAYEVNLVVGVKPQVTAIRNLSAWPNPFAQELNLKLEAVKSGSATVVIKDAVGRVVYSKAFDVAAGSNELQLDVQSSLAKGIYLLSLEMEGQLETYKHIRQ